MGHPVLQYCQNLISWQGGPQQVECIRTERHPTQALGARQNGCALHTFGELNGSQNCKPVLTPSTYQSTSFTILSSILHSFNTMFFLYLSKLSLVYTIPAGHCAHCESFCLGRPGGRSSSAVSGCIIHAWNTWWTLSISSVRLTNTSYEEMARWYTWDIPYLSLLIPYLQRLQLASRMLKACWTIWASCWTICWMIWSFYRWLLSRFCCTAWDLRQYLLDWIQAAWVAQLLLWALPLSNYKISQE